MFPILKLHVLSSALGTRAHSQHMPAHTCSMCVSPVSHNHTCAVCPVLCLVPAHTQHMLAHSHMSVSSSAWSSEHSLSIYLYMHHVLCSRFCFRHQSTHSAHACTHVFYVCISSESIWIHKNMSILSEAMPLEKKNASSSFINHRMPIIFREG